MAQQHFLLALFTLLFTLTPPSLTIPNPCNPSTNYRPPVYSLSNFAYKKQYADSVRKGAAKFTVTDLANGNYSIDCSNNELTMYHEDPGDLFWHGCHVSSLLNKEKGAVQVGYRFLYPSGAVQILWQWVCLAEDRGPPKTYLALADWKLSSPLNCPDDHEPIVWDGPVINCTLSSDEKGLVPKAAIWVPATPSVFTNIPVRPNNTSALTPASRNSTCVAKSFMYPGWSLDEYVAGEGSDISLSLRQASTGYRLNCHLGPLDEKLSCSGDADWAQHGLLTTPETQLQWDNATRQISVNQSWTCAEGFQRSQRPTFTSTGALNISRGCTANACGRHAFSIPGTLSQPVSLHPTLPPPPAGIHTPNCSAASISPSWTISNLKQTQTQTRLIPILTDSIIRRGILDFDLFNHANNITTHCHIEGEGLTNYTGYSTTQNTVGYDKWWSCDQLPPGTLSPGDEFPKRNLLSTAIQFNKNVPFLVVNQTWFCQGEGEDHLTSYTATINNTLLLQCNDTSPCFPFSDPCMPGLFDRSEACSVPTPLSLTAPTSAAAALPADPVLIANNSCTIRSSLSPTFTITEWSAVTWYSRFWPPNYPNISGSGYYSQVTFNLWNSGLGRSVPVGIQGQEITPYNSHWVGNVTGKWHLCWTNETWQGKRPPVPGSTGCEFKLDLETGYIAVRVGWVCDELDGEHPIHFEATAATYLDLQCSLGPSADWDQGIATYDYKNKGSFSPSLVSSTTEERKVG